MCERIYSVTTPGEQDKRISEALAEEISAFISTHQGHDDYSQQTQIITPDISARPFRNGKIIENIEPVSQVTMYVCGNCEKILVTHRTLHETWMISSVDDFS